MTAIGEKPDEKQDAAEGLRLVAENPYPGLAAHRLGKSFKKRPVLRDVSLYVQRGEAVGRRLDGALLPQADRLLADAEATGEVHATQAGAKPRRLQVGTEARRPDDVLDDVRRHVVTRRVPAPAHIASL